jgi:hypothetical protein
VTFVQPPGPQAAGHTRLDVAVTLDFRSFPCRDERVSWRLTGNVLGVRRTGHVRYVEPGTGRM